MNFLLVHSEVIAAVRDKLIVLDESTAVKEQLNSLASSKFVAFVLLIDPVEPASKESLFFNLFKSLDEGLLKLSGAASSRSDELRGP